MAFYLHGSGDEFLVLEKNKPFLFNDFELYYMYYVQLTFFDRYPLIACDG